MAVSGQGPTRPPHTGGKVHGGATPLPVLRAGRVRVERVHGGFEALLHELFDGVSRPTHRRSDGVALIAAEPREHMCGERSEEHTSELQSH